MVSDYAEWLVGVWEGALEESAGSKEEYVVAGEDGGGWRPCGYGVGFSSC